MPNCVTCGSRYDPSFQFVVSSLTRTSFECFECVIRALSPPCTGCGRRVVGPGVECGGFLYCSERCAAPSALRASPESEAP